MKRILPLATIALALLAGCQSMPSGATPVPAAEIEQMLTGRTWFWNTGENDGMYFGADGMAYYRHEGNEGETTWEARPGAFCAVGGESGKDFCWSLFRKDGDLYSASQFQDEHKEPYPWDPAQKTVAGNRIK